MRERRIQLIGWMMFVFVSFLPFGCSDQEQSPREPPAGAVLSKPSNSEAETYEAAKEKQKIKQELQERSENRKDM